MIKQVLIPGMKNLNNTGCCSEILFIKGKFQKCLGAASVEQSIKKFLVTVNQRIQFVGKCKYHMKIGRIYHFRPAFIHPYFFFDCLTVGTIAVTTGIVMNFCVTAVFTNTGVVSKRTGFTVKNRKGSFFLNL